MRQRSVTLSTIALALLLPSYSTAAPILDQAFEAPLVSLHSSGVGFADKSQVFTVGITGLLVRVDVDIAKVEHPPSLPPPDNLVFDIRATAAGIPLENDALILATVTVPAGDIPLVRGLLTFDLSTLGVAVTAGQVLAIVLRSPGDENTDYSWFGDFDGYAGGAEYFRNPFIGFNTWGLVLDTTGVTFDLGFQTFVDPAESVPQPGALLLLAAGSLTGAALGRLRGRP